MAKERNRKKLTLKQANRISLLIAGIYFIFTVVSGLNGNFPNRETAIMYWILGCFAGTIFLYGTFYFIIFDAENRKKEEANRKTELEAIQYLSKNEFTEVYFNIANPKNLPDEIIQILQCIRYDVKLAEDNKIIIIVKSKSNEEICRCEIENPVDFALLFKVNAD
ncbi:MAG: hypothetical protein K2H53_04100 [Clostridia bacterium]|nr:hypothetical protein [Clostridia bacterium]